MTLSLGEITMTEDQVVTPAGSVPVGDVIWAISDWSEAGGRPKSSALQTALNILSPLFAPFAVLARRGRRLRSQGWIEVTVSGANMSFTTEIPTGDARDADAVREKFASARAQTEAAKNARP